jgi:hypothetical protein
MSASDFLTICGTGFLAVFILLSLLAVLMRLLTLAFPEVPEGESDAQAIAAIAVAMNSLYPGTRITRIEKQK